jgi:hypothetical protein
MNSLALVIDTNSRYSDVWSPCFGRLEKFFPKGLKKYVCVDKGFEEKPHTVNTVPEDFVKLLYDDNETYRNQFLGCLEQIEEEFILYTSEDYILFDLVNQEKISYILEALSNSDYSFVKLTKGPEEVSPHKGYEKLFVIDPNGSNFFAQQASVWRTRDFERMFRASPESNGRMQQEPGGSDVCRSIGMTKGLQYHDCEKKRGLFHYDSSVFPHIATAVVKGKWNIKEYFLELMDVFDEYSIDMSSRGTNA